jgi:ribosomal protein L10
MVDPWRIKLMAAEKPVTQKRKRGKKNPTGETRALILQYILNIRVSQTDDIRDYLREKGPKRLIKTKNLVYDHIKKLEQEGYIKRIPGGKGKTDSYTANDGFDAFKKIFTFLKEHHDEKTLMNTEYYKNNIRDDEFWIKAALNIAKLDILDLYYKIKDENTKEQLIDDIKANPPRLIRPPFTWGEYRQSKYGYTEQVFQPTLKDLTRPTVHDYTKEVITIIEKIHRGDESEQLVKQFLDLIRTLEGDGKDADRFYDVYRARLESKPGDHSPVNVNVHLKQLVSLMLPEDQTEKAINILSISPSAVDFVLNSKYYDYGLLYFVLMSYFSSEPNLDIRYITEVFDYTPRVDRTLYLRRLFEAPKENLDLSSIVNRPPFIAILEALVITDSVKGNIDKNEQTRQTLTDILRRDGMEGV